MIVDRTPTDEDIAQYIAAIMGFQPGTTPQQKLNYLQDWSKSIGFDPFGQPFQGEQFPFEEFAPVTREIYATDPNSPYSLVFDLMDGGAAPDAAVREAFERGQFGGGQDLTPDERRDIFRTAREYATESRNFRAEQAKWERQQAQAAAKAPVTLQEILYPTTGYDVLSGALGAEGGATVQDLSRLYAQRLKSRADQAGGAPSEVGKAPSVGREEKKDSGGWGSRLKKLGALAVSPPWFTETLLFANAALRGRPQPGDEVAAEQAAGGKSFGPAFGSGQKPLEAYTFDAGGDPNARLRREAFDRAANQVMTQLGEMAFRSPREQNVMRNIAYMNLIPGGM